MLAQNIPAIDTPKGRLIKRKTAYIDGRDLDVRPFLTVMMVNVWHDVPPTKAAGQLQHGTKVTIVDIHYYSPESRHYLLIQSDECLAWISAPFLSDEYHKPVGDRF